GAGGRSPTASSRPHPAGYLDAVTERHRCNAPLEKADAGGQARLPHHARGPHFCHRSLPGRRLGIPAQTVCCVRARTRSSGGPQGTLLCVAPYCERCHASSPGTFSWAPAETVGVVPPPARVAPARLV